MADGTLESRRICGLVGQGALLELPRRVDVTIANT